jgi:hypothetical protein
MKSGGNEVDESDGRCRAKANGGKDSGDTVHNRHGCDNVDELFRDGNGSTQDSGRDGRSIDRGDMVAEGANIGNTPTCPLGRVDVTRTAAVPARVNGHPPGAGHLSRCRTT